jgi:hypothetical protein
MTKRLPSVEKIAERLYRASLVSSVMMSLTWKESPSDLKDFWYQLAREVRKMIKEYVRE